MIAFGGYHAARVVRRTRTMGSSREVVRAVWGADWRRLRAFIQARRAQRLYRSEFGGIVWK